MSSERWFLLHSISLVFLLANAIERQLAHRERDAVRAAIIALSIQTSGGGDG